MAKQIANRMANAMAAAMDGNMAHSTPLHYYMSPWSFRVVQQLRIAQAVTREAERSGAIR